MRISLGIWHTYKQACYQIYKKFAGVLFGPYFHFGKPAERFRLRPKYLSFIERTLVVMFLAGRPLLDSWKSSLAAIPAHYQPMAENFIDLIQFFIPTVKVCYFNLSSLS